MEHEDLRQNNELLKLNIFKLPKPAENKEQYDYFPLYVASILSEYQEAIQGFCGITNETITKEKDNIENLCASISRSIELYYKGKTTQAYKALESGINRVSNLLTMWREPYSAVSDQKSVYRARVDEHFHSINSYEEMFHVPMESRGKIGNQRFSISGLPCLYTGNSTYICWVELGCPDINKVQFSRLKFNEKSVKIIDLATFPGTVLKYTETTLKIVSDKNDEKMIERYISDQKLIAYYAIVWPLIFSCSIKVKDSQNIFKPEYIIPQLLLQWSVDNENIDGIKYYSINMNPFHVDTELVSTNKVFPIKASKERGYCDYLTKMFQITYPITIQHLLIHYPWMLSKKMTDEEIKNSADPRRTLSILRMPNRIGGQFYEDTIFGKIEELLDNEQLNTII